uniref:Uncharacterized protein n=1 Tax=Arundo donax TaxID=35708 RepID=A0A0A9ASC5_ARUDO
MSPYKLHVEERSLLKSPVRPYR